MISDRILDARRKRFCAAPQHCRAKGDGLCYSCEARERVYWRRKRARVRGGSHGRRSPPVTLAGRA